MRPNEVQSQIRSLTADLIEIGLCNSQKYPAVREEGEVVEIGIPGITTLSTALRNIPYVDIYNELCNDECYNLKMIDGALIQMLYTFIGAELLSHRLAFFPSPDLAEFQNNVDLYETDEIYADILARNIVVFPLRFDFVASDDKFEEIHHPRSHLSLGQYKNCRIPVSAPVTPFRFLDFILRSFYNTAHRKYCDSLRPIKGRFESTIALAERGVVHIEIPA